MIPTLRFRFSHGRGQLQSASFRQQEPGTSRRSADHDLRFGATLTFDLPRVAYHRQEPILWRQRQSLLRAQARVVQRVITLYFRIQQLLMEEPLELEEEIELNKKQAQLRALTGLH